MIKIVPAENHINAFLTLSGVLKVWLTTKYNIIYFNHFKNNACKLIDIKGPLLTKENPSATKKSRTIFSFFISGIKSPLVTNNLPKKNNTDNPKNDSIKAEEKGIQNNKRYKLTAQA
jgi:hypothetical protein